MKIAYAVFAWMIILSYVATFIFGVVRFPNPPYHQEGVQFVDKLGQQVTVEDYHRFELWQDTLFLTVIPFALLAMGGAILARRPTVSSRSERLAQTSDR